MRAAVPSILALLALAPLARADVGMPGFKFTSGSRVVHFGPEVQRYRVFAVCHGRCVAVELGEDRIARIPHLGPRGIGESLCAIPVETPLPEKINEEWLKAVPGAIWSGTFRESLRRDHVFCDPRDGYTLHYRATLTATEMGIELTEDRVEWSWPTVLVMAFLSLALALGGIWAIRRLRRRSVTRTVPPPGN